MTQQWTEAPLSGFEALAPEPKPAIGERVHPFAAQFPMLPDDEFADLVMSIQANGLIRPLVVDADGLLIDGRNRQAACTKAEVEPRYEQLPPGMDPVAYIVAVNVDRRHMSKGARAMAVALSVELLLSNRLRHGERRDLARSAGVSGARMSQAVVVRQWAAELVDAVMHDGSLNDAYAIALQRKQDAEFQAKELDRLEREYPALALQVNSGELTLTQARAMAAAQERAKAESAEIARLRQQIALSREEVGDPRPLPPRREIVTQFSEPPRPEFARNSDGQADALRTEQAFLQQLIHVRQLLTGLAAVDPLTEVSWREGHLNAVRSAAAQMVTAVYQLVDAHEAALGDSPTLREVK